MIRVKTKNYAHCGTHRVKIKGDFVYKGNSVSVAYGNEFNIVIDCCDTKSCLYTSLIPHDSAVDLIP